MGFKNIKYADVMNDLPSFITDQMDTTTNSKIIYKAKHDIYFHDEDPSIKSKQLVIKISCHSYGMGKLYDIPVKLLFFDKETKTWDISSHFIMVSEKDLKPLK